MREKSIRQKLTRLVISCVLALGMMPVVAMAEEAPISSLEDQLSESPALVSESSALVAESSGESGVRGLAKPSLKELQGLYGSLPAHPSINNMWSQVPNVAGYEAGTLSPSALGFSASYLNLLRRAANLDSVSLDASLNASASEGALILARLDEGLTHTPPTPAGVSDARAQAGKDACGTSNLSYSWGSGEPLRMALQGQVSDDDLHNMPMVGHRRWILNPRTKTMGIGSAMGDSGAVYTALRVFGNGVSTSAGVSYEYVAWPPSGAMLSELFPVGTPWSVTLNPSLYAAPSKNSVVVRVRRVSDGRTWTLSSEDATPTETGEYFNVDNLGYGINNCIIFNPGASNLGANSYMGSYEVTITGIRTSSGADTTLSYTVDFGDMNTKVPSSGRVRRLAGQGRYDTMASVVAEGFDKSEWAVVATGANFPDALAASALAGARKCPVVLTTPNGLCAQADSTLRGLGVKKVYVMGGLGAVSSEVEKDLKVAGITEIQRVQGADRVGTSLDTMREVRTAGSKSSTVVITTSMGYADALSVGSWSYATSSPVVLAGRDGLLSDEAVAMIKGDSLVRRVVVVGGTRTVGNVEGQLAGEGYEFVRLDGSNRYETSARVATWASSEGLGWSFPAVATGRGFPDALAGTAMCGAKGSVLLLADGSGDPAVGLVAQNASAIERLYVLGGESAVGESLVASLDGAIA